MMKRFFLVLVRLLLTFLLYLIAFLFLSALTSWLFGFTPGYLIKFALIYGCYRLSKRIIPIPHSYQQSSILTEDDVRTEDADVSPSSPHPSEKSKIESITFFGEK